MKKIKSFILSCMLIFSSIFGALGYESIVLAADTALYPAQAVNFTAYTTARNLNKSNTSLNTQIASGSTTENWRIDYVSSGVYNIVNMSDNSYLTANETKCITSSASGNSNQQWNIIGTDKDFLGNYLYYKIVNVSTGKAITYYQKDNSIGLDQYTNDGAQKWKLNCYGLEGFAANSKMSEGEKAGTIGGLLGETIFISDMTSMKEALLRTEPLTIVLTANIDCSGENYDWMIEDNKTIIGSYQANQMRDCKLRTNDYYGKLDPSDNIIIRNMKFQVEVNPNMLVLAIYSSKNIWVDHCTFEIASDGNIDLENGATGVTISWCKIGDEATEKPSEDSSIYQSIMFMEGRYQKGELKADTSLYHQLRTGGATPEQIMAYTAYHKKCHLNGSGDKDFVNYKRSNGTVVEDANSNIRLTLAYNHYLNPGQRVPMIRQGVGNLINCYIDDSTHQTAAAAHPIFAEKGPYSLSRCINSRNGASIAADTCVFEGVEEPITGAEYQGMDTNYMAPEWAIMFQNVKNNALIVNSTVTNSKGTYTGSSWDNNGDNLFTTGFRYKDKSTVGNWAWASHIVNEDQYEKRDYTVEEAKPMEFTYDTNGVLPYQYQTLPLEDVKEVVGSKSGAGVMEMTSAEWTKTKYIAADYSAVDAAIEKANALNPEDYVDFSGVTAAIEAVDRDLMSDDQTKVDAMAKAIEDAIAALVKVDNSDDTNVPSDPDKGDGEDTSNEPTEPDSVPEPDEEGEAPKTGDSNMAMMYILLLGSSAGIAGITALMRKKCKN